MSAFSQPQPPLRVLLSDGTIYDPEVECAKGQHAWVPWLAVHRGGMETNGIAFYVTWCAREGCNHSESWDCP